MKVHAGADAGSGYVHTITGTSANMHDVSEAANLIREDDEVVYGDSGYLGAVNQSAIKDDETKSRIEFRVNKRPSSLKIRLVGIRYYICRIAILSCSQIF